MSAAVVQAMVAGNAALQRGSPADLAAARTAFEQAVKLDERYAPAHAALAQALVMAAEAAVDRPSTLLPKAIEHGDLAVELDPAGALGWSWLARAEELWTRDWSRAEMHYRRAIALDAGARTAASQLAELLAALGRSREALDQSAAVQSLEPTNAALHLSSGKVRYLVGDHARALQHFQLALSNGGARADIAPWEARAHAALGNLAEALDAAQRGGEAAGRSSWAVAYVHALAGRRAAAEAVLADIGTRAAREYVPTLEFAYVRAALGQRDEALSFVETAVREHSPGSELLLVDPIFADLRAEPRFRAALAEARLGTGR